MAIRSKLQRALSAPLKSLSGIGAEADSLRAGAAIGMALCPEDGNDLDTLLRHADADMYRHKMDSRATPRAVS
jgi:GGDEF domain-containing protein